MKNKTVTKLEKLKKKGGMPLNYQFMTIKVVESSELVSFDAVKIDFYQSELTRLKRLEKPISKMFYTYGV